MKILHTSDWHIGQVFKNFSRKEEHELFFFWLRELIEKENIEVLLVAGDIFDVAHPSSLALKTYYNFLTSLQNTSCKKIVITGGNHDGVATLDAPKEILELLDISVISGEKNSMDDKENLLIKIYDNDKLNSIICAVPFLRDSIVRKSVANQSSADVETQLKEGIKNYYKETLHLAQQISKDVPIIAMGHLSVMGTQSSQSEQDIYIGKLQSLNSSVFDGYDYVALGHLHRSQRVASSDTIRYSGSPIPLSFSEINNEKKVLIIDTTDKNITVQELLIPRFRKLYHLKGILQDVLSELKNLATIEENLTPLIEVTIENEFVTSNTIDAIYEQIEESDLEVLQINSQNKEKQERNNMEIQHLDDITPLKAFETKFDENSELLEDAELKESVIDCFKEIMEQIDEDS